MAKQKYDADKNDAGTGPLAEAVGNSGKIADLRFINAARSPDNFPINAPEQFHSHPFAKRVRKEHKKFLFLNSSRPDSAQRDFDSVRHTTGNIGNSYISYGISRSLGASDSNTLWNSTIWSETADPDKLIESAKSVDHILLAMQDQIRTDLPDRMYKVGYAFLRKLAKLDAPLTVFSLGANRIAGQPADVARNLSRDKLRFFRALAERAQTLGVRGEFTANVLSDMGITNVEMIGCPSYFETGPSRYVRPMRLGSKGRLGVTGLIHSAPGSLPLYLLQGDYEMPVVDLLYMPETEWCQRQEHERILENPSLMPVVRAATDGRVAFMPDLEMWKEFLSEHCYAVVGTRLHGAIAALNAGVPALVANDDERAREVCSFLGIPWVPLAQIESAEPHAIVDMCDVSAVNKLYSRRYNQFVGWMKSCGLSPEPTPTDGFRQPKIEPQPPRVVTARARAAVRHEVTRLYELYAMRRPTTSELSRQCDNAWKANSLAPVVAEISANPAGNIVHFGAITRNYLEYFGRAPTQSEVLVWAEALENGQPLSAVRHALLNTPEGHKISVATVKTLYSSIIGRKPQPFEVDEWIGTYRKGGNHADLRQRLFFQESVGRDAAADIISDTFQKHLGRPATKAEQTILLNAFRHRAIIDELSETFYAHTPITK